MAIKRLNPVMSAPVDMRFGVASITIPAGDNNANVNVTYSTPLPQNRNYAVFVQDNTYASPYTAQVMLQVREKSYQRFNLFAITDGVFGNAVTHSVVYLAIAY